MMRPFAIGASELRRRIVRGALRPLYRIVEGHPARLREWAAADIHRVLVCRPNHRLGNLVLLTPLLCELQRMLPDAAVDIVLAGRHGAELFAGFGNVARIYTLSDRVVRHPLATVRTVLAIRQAHYDFAIDPCASSQSGRLLAAVAGARFTLDARRQRTESCPPSHGPLAAAPTHMAQWPVYWLRRSLAGAPEDGDPGFPLLDIQLAPNERAAARTTLAELLCAAGGDPDRPVLGVFANATGVKRYSADWWRRFLDELRRQHADARVVEVAPPNGRRRLDGAGPSFASPNLREVAALIANMTWFVSADCGVMHLASAAGVPTCGLFSVTDPRTYAPYGHASQALDTCGQTPEVVAQRVHRWMETVRTINAPAEERSAQTTAHGGASIAPAPHRANGAIE